jgi:hypothetical protein
LGHAEIIDMLRTGPLLRVDPSIDLHGHGRRHQ